MADLWSDSADLIIRSMEEGIKSKYGIPLSEFLENPLQFADKEGIYDTASKIKEEIGDAIDAVLGRMADEKRKLDEDAALCDTATNQILQSITVHSEQEKVPIVKADMISREEEETIYVSSMGPAIDAMVGKLCRKSNFIADFTAMYNGRKIGEWFFGGDKNYVLKVNLKPNAAFNLYNTREEIMGILDNDMEMIRGVGK